LRGQWNEHENLGFVMYTTHGPGDPRELFGELPSFDDVGATGVQFPLDRISEAFETAEWLGREGGSVVTRAIVCP
jgi:hypothetical protein